MSELKEKKEVKPKSKKKAKGKKKGKVNKPGKKELVDTGPPQKPEDFSSNWKAFLKTQQTKIAATQTTDESNNLNVKKSKKRKVLEEETQQNSTNPKKKKLKRLVENGEEIQQKKTKRNKKKRRSIVENDNVKSNEDIWFDVDPKLLEKVSSLDLNKTTEQKDGNISDGTPEVDSTEALVTRRIAIDCEMVGIGFEGKENVLARVSVVNSKCQCVYDKYVMSEEKIVDYRTHVSGIRPSDLKDASEFSLVQKEVCDILKDRVLVGHAVHNDLKVLLLSHPKRKTRDTSKYKPFRKLLKTKRPALKRLAEEILHKEIQVGEHDSVKDAQITMELYNKHRKEWEKSLRCKKEDSTVQPKEIYMGNQNEKKKTKVNKWKKIRDRKKKKKKLQEEE